MRQVLVRKAVLRQQRLSVLTVPGDRAGDHQREIGAVDRRLQEAALRVRDAVVHVDRVAQKDERVEREAEGQRAPAQELPDRAGKQDAPALFARACARVDQPQVLEDDQPAEQNGGVDGEPLLSCLLCLRCGACCGGCTLLCLRCGGGACCLSCGACGDLRGFRHLPHAEPRAQDGSRRKHEQPRVAELVLRGIENSARCEKQRQLQPLRQDIVQEQKYCVKTEEIKRRNFHEILSDLSIIM